MQALERYEIDYLKSQLLGRIATVNASGQPHVTPVGFRYNEDSGTIDVGGHNLSATKKAKDIEQNPRVSFVVDDLESLKPWHPRGITIRGTAVIYENQQRDAMFGSTWIRIIPERVISWGIARSEFAIH